ncbi:MAG: glycine cleavage system protein H [Euryarchaeota archaeon]|nr:glycine cleavage system protein H [Euryarchaeota archaeon]|tara:strand:- start:30497 stop:30877 length:381 start_codon:yes stop_codon:yes gene_type:complete
MSSIPEGLSYTAEHEWVRIENEVATIGVTDYAQDALTDVVWVELPVIGDVVKSMEAFASVESVKSVSEIYAPLSGEVVEVNDNLETAPETINLDPYGEGWICKIKLDTDDLSGLMNHEKYRELLGE